MTKFELFLIDKGYLMFAFDAKKGVYYKPKTHIISTMVNLGHIYIHNSDTNLLNKIENNEEITHEDRVNQIVFGLNQADRPPTLIYPRPNIKVKRKKIIDNEEYFFIENESLDDSMNIVLSKIDFEEIFKAMYDKSMCFEFDLT